MPVYVLDSDLNFPPVFNAEPDGLLAVGGDLSPQRLLLAYQNGIFPWYSDNDPILWWSPDPRLVLYPDELKISRSMRPVFNQKKFRFTLDTDFPAVIGACQEMDREGQNGTWITEEMREAYETLHALGFAHSVEVWQDDGLVAGVYGISMGTCFFGESMFTTVSNASKAGFIHLVLGLRKLGFGLIDCQVKTKHLVSLGAREIPRRKFIQHLRADDLTATLRGPWTDIPEFRHTWPVEK